mmetsp:Transcript_71761/g.155852  ORF Transcript_71761/g.155852 Transcript_71761/m.155852 type:complete len:109 (+) Transcript_71761:77-403(+)|eukprot:CAMPEP_0170597576 /NCGR_PEP_ID=MMETSP0224-20130122/15781_1 /TAXON_ID=285029 /ORGANISM="Togula jolla, Strain CCCM 725" /LENGTH=108 /DNA_ID=CAMNT_0010922057 /DNA_START=58 /DNA_END=384 /DNA_ORIENTATION=+
MAAAAQGRRASGLLVGLLGLAVVATLVHFGPAFVGSGQAPTDAAQLGLRGAALSAPAAVLAAPLAASAATALPTPVLGVGLLSVIVVIVLLISSVAIGRGLVETIDDL